MANLFTMERCSDFDTPKRGERVTHAFITATESEVYAAGLESSECVYDRGEGGYDWTLRVPLDDIADAPRCARCEIASTTLDDDDLCGGGEADPGDYSEPDPGVDEGPRDHIAYFARLGRAGY